MTKKITIQEITSLVKRNRDLAKKGELDRKQIRIGCGDGLCVEVTNNTAAAVWAARYKNKYKALGDAIKMPYQSARAKADDFIAQEKAKKAEANQAPTLVDYFNNTYMPNKLKTFKKSSRRQNEYVCLFNKMESLHRLKLNEITKRAVIQAAAALDLSNRRRRETVKVISHVLDNACNNGLIENNVLSGIFSRGEAPFTPENTKHHDAPMPDDFVPKVMQKLKDTEEFYRAFYLMLALTAFRPTEARALKWDYIHLDDMLIVIPPDAEGANKHGRGDKEGKETIKPITTEMLLLLQYLKSVDERNSDFVFQSPCSKQMRPIAATPVRNRWNKFVNAEGKVCDMHGVRRVLKTWAEAQRKLDNNGRPVRMFSPSETRRAMTHDDRSGVDGTYDMNSIALEALPVMKAWNKWLLTRLPNEYLEILNKGKAYPLK